MFYCRLCFLLLICVTIPTSRSQAGGGPENLLLLVNSNSIDSKTVANHYIALRNIPANNVVYIDWRSGLEACQGKYFSEQILRPAIKAINERGLGAQIDYVVYSCDFPSKVGLESLLTDAKFGAANRPWASITGATYLWQFVRDKNPALMLPMVNLYVSPSSSDNYGQCQEMANTESRGFRATYFWTPNGTKTNDGSKGQAYLLSTMLGVSQGRGNTVDEILSYLNRSVKADGTRPRGTFYYMRNNDVRSKTRHDCYDVAAGLLKQMGQPAIVAPGVIPTGATDVLGIMTGSAKFDFPKSGAKLLPGAICDHLTSYGGDLSAKMGQTPLSVFLRAGAAGASGTVFEPLALQSKFPLPSLFIHYARGCSLAESFFQAVSGPYMLLIVGDPLCQPFAVLPLVEMDGIRPGQEVKGTLTIKASSASRAPKGVGSMELFVDGRLVARYAPGGKPQLDTTKLSDGYHELRVVAVNANSIQSRGRQIVPIVVNNRSGAVELTAFPSANVAVTDTVRISAKQEGAETLVIRQNRREIARIKGPSGDVEVLAATFGRGPVTLQAESLGPNPALSSRIELQIR